MGGGGRSPLPFFENWKKCPNLGKKCPNCVHLRVKCLVFKSFQAKKPDIFLPAGHFFSRAVAESLSKCPNSEKTLLLEKIPGYAPAAKIEWNIT